MLHPFDFWNVHQAPDGLFIKNLAVRRKHLSQLECQHVRESLARGLIDSSLLIRRFSVQPPRLKQNRNSAAFGDGVHLLSVELNHIAGLPLDVSAPYKPYILSQRLPCPAQPA